MVLPSEDDRDAIDRAFAELVAGYHLTADPPDQPTNEPPTEPVTPMPDGAPNWATDHPLFGLMETPDVPPSPTPSRTATSQAAPPSTTWFRPCLSGSARVTRSPSCGLSALRLALSRLDGLDRRCAAFGGRCSLLSRRARSNPPEPGDGAALRTRAADRRTREEQRFPSPSEDEDSGSRSASRGRGSVAMSAGTERTRSASQSTGHRHEWARVRKDLGASGLLLCLPAARPETKRADSGGSIMACRASQRHQSASALRKRASPSLPPAEATSRSVL